MKRIANSWVVAFLLVGCSREAPQPPAPVAPATVPHAHVDEPEAHESLPTKVRLSAEVIKNSKIKASPAAVGLLAVTVDLTGEIAADPDRSARITARVPGRIVAVNFKEGMKVKAGQVLATIESPQLARDRATYSAAAARANTAKLEVERLKGLVARSLAPEQALAVATSEWTAFEAEARAARITLTSFGTDVLSEMSAETARLSLRSPIAGSVLSRNAIVGQNVESGHVVADIGDLDRVYFLGRLFEKDLAQVKAGARTDVRLNAYPGEVFDGVVESIGKSLDATARTVIARIVLSDRGGMLKTGLFGRAQVVIDKESTRERRVVVPIGSVTRLADRDVVFVQQSDGDFEVHPVTLGNSAGGQVELLSGIREGENVVVDGVFTLKSAVLKSTFGEDE
jgi:membrane fusion protein, heavy metal efflux system